MKKLRRYFRIVPIDILVYRMTEIGPSPGELPYAVDEANDGKNMRYSILDNGQFVHRSFLYPEVHVLKLIGKSGPAIGNCVTTDNYRGQSIYPKMIHRIATGLLGKGVGEVFIVVNSDNIASIRGIEKAGFELFASIKAKRFLLFYFDKQIKYFG